MSERSSGANVRRSTSGRDDKIDLAGRERGDEVVIDALDNRHGETR
jgi:hypothetical protein